MKYAKNIEYFIIKGLYENDEYLRQVVSNIDPIYFDDTRQPIVEFLKNYFAKYHKIPEYSTTINSLCNEEGCDEKVVDEIIKVKELEFNSIAEKEWLYNETKSFINKMAMIRAVKDCVEEMKQDKIDSGKIHLTLQKALTIDWNEDLGIEYFDEKEFDNIYDYLSDSTKRIPLGINLLDSMINGGIPSHTKFLGVFVGQAGIGKTAILSNVAVNAIKAGKNVLYITLEIDKRELKKRFDSTFTGYSLFNILELRQNVKEKLTKSRNHEKAGRCIIQEFPPSSVSVFDIKNYIKQLEIKKFFKPDVIIMDYLGIMAPTSPRDCKNSYERGKTISEELRRLSSELNIPLLSAVQSTRSTYGESNMGMDGIADSIGIAHTADLIISIVQPEDLKENSQMKFEIIKSRISPAGRSGIVNFDKKTLRIINQVDLKEDDSSSNIIKEMESDKDIK